MCIYNNSYGRSIRIIFQIKKLRLKQNRFEKFRNSLSCFGRNTNHRGISSPIFWSKTMLCKILFDSFKIFSWFINLGNSNNNRHTRFLCMSDRLDRLWHHTIISSNYNDCNISQFCSSRSQTRKQLMSWSINEAYFFAFIFHDRSSDRLSNTSSFSISDNSFSEIIKQ